MTDPMRSSPYARFNRSVACRLATMLFVLSSAAYADVEYAYDDAGRLVGVISPTGDVAQYLYDPAGNITAINRYAATALSLIEFQPKSGPTGTQVTIWGSGFSTIAANNQVTFNGAVATVLSSTGNKLTVTVPAAASTGSIAVSVSANTATSAQPYTVTSATSCASRLTGMAPVIGTSGTSVTISGSGFDRGPNVTTFNGLASAAGSALSNSLTVNVPAGATSGRLVVSTTPLCHSSPVGDFFVPPSPYTATDIGATGRLSINGPAVTAALASNKKALYVFDGTASGATGVYLSGSTLGNVIMSIRAPDGSITSQATIAASAGQLGIVALPMTGGYSVFLNPTTSAAGGFTLQLGGPDLAISNPGVGIVTGNQNGSFNVPVSFTVTNLGAVTANPNWIDYAYLSRGPTFDPASPVAGSTIRNTALGAGSSYSVNQTYVASGVLPGAYYLFIRTDSSASGLADSTGSVRETNEANNLTSIPITLPPYPDLAVSNAAIGTITVNQNGTYNIPVSFTVSNLSTSPALPNWFDYGYLSANGVHDTASVVLGSNFRNAQLAGGASYNVNQTYLTSGIGPGAYTVYLKADGQSGTSQTGPGLVAESNETNNEVGVSVVLPMYADLVVSNPSVGTITESRNGTFSIPVSFTVTNSGSSPATPNWNDFAYISANGALDASSTNIGVAFRNTALAVGSSYTINQTYSTTKAPGNYTIFFKADGSTPPTGGGVVAESNESNNASAGVPIVLPAYPDLVISNPSIGTVTKNSNGTWNIPVIFTVTNNGGSPAQPTWNDAAFLSANGVLDSSSTFIGSVFRGNVLAVNASYTITQTFVTGAVSPGAYSVFVQADGTTIPASTGLVTEGSESNNVTPALSVTLN